MSDFIGDFGYHGTLDVNFAQGYLGGVYDKLRVERVAHKELQITHSKDIARAFAMRASADAFPGTLPFSNERIMILWGRQISFSAISVDLIFKPKRQGAQIVYEDITDTFLVDS